MSWAYQWNSFFLLFHEQYLHEKLKLRRKVYIEILIKCEWPAIDSLPSVEAAAFLICQ